MLLLLFQGAATPTIPSFQPGFQPGYQAIGPWPPVSTSGGRLRHGRRMPITPDRKWELPPQVTTMRDWQDPPEELWLLGLIDDDELVRLN